ncbi:hypothetical protein HanIR_Chr07g0332851 [Helianthus annuus]|nr:hypothetical protein HanIR_Chr07g0332851 [Helianthus annuus]KAJ0729469.1 hypothetical protein HanLR1_Chr07g0253251 [Helianthus annuus]
MRTGEKALVIPDRVEAFKDRHGLAVVGRTVNLETLVDIDRLLNIAKVVVANVQYLGGLSLLISFHDEESMKAFLDRKNIWELWFSKLDPWKGQTLPFERVAWLKLVGIPLHVMDADVLSQVGARFGKVIHVPKAFEEDQDLSFVRVGVLVGNSRRIIDEVVLRWRNRTFRIGIEEDQEAWVPDYARRMSESVPDDSPSSEFSPVDNVQFSGEVEVGVSQASEGLGADEKSPEERGSGSHAEGSEVHGEHGVYVVSGCYEERDSVGGGRVNVAGAQPFLSSAVNPEVEVGGNDPSVTSGNKSSFNFFMGPSEVGSGKSIRKSRLGLRSRMGQSSSPKDISPDSLRPKKRGRSEPNDFPPGFGFIGFTSRGGEAAVSDPSVVAGNESNIDLNVRASSEECAVGDQDVAGVHGGGVDQQGGLSPN